MLKHWRHKKKKSNNKTPLNKKHKKMFALDVLTWLTKFDVEKKVFSKQDSDTWSSLKPNNKGTKQPCMIQAYVRSKKESPSTTIMCMFKRFSQV